MKVKSLIRLDKFLDVKIRSIKDNSTAILHYALMDHSVALRWLDLVSKGILNQQEISQNYRKHRTPEEIQDIFVKFLETIDFINQIYDTNLEKPKSWNDLNDDILNRLHKEFETYGERISTLVSTNQFSNDLHEKFLRLNELIHILQFLKKNQKSLRMCTVDFLPVGKHLSLEKEDYMLFTTDSQWGWLYLGYNTLGKPWSTVCIDDDLLTVKEKKVKPQKRFAAEFSINFNHFDLTHWKRMYIYKWWLSNNVSEVIDTEQTGELALGNIPLGIFAGYSKDTITYSAKDIDRHSFNIDVWDKCDVIDSVKIIKDTEVNQITLDFVFNILDQFR